MTFIQKTQRLRQEGKIHWFLLLRLRLLLLTSLIMGGIFAYNILFEGLNQVWGLFFTLGGFLLGFTIFSRMNIIDWDRTTQQVKGFPMDIVAIGIFIAYLLLEIVIHTTFKEFFSTSAILFILSFAFGTIAGRTMALSLKINNAYEKKM